MLIDPVLEPLGWNVRDWDDVQREYKVKPKDKPVDYALRISRLPKLYIEAKGLGERRWKASWRRATSPTRTTSATW
jgi:hypothetical protein